MPTGSPFAPLPSCSAPCCGRPPCFQVRVETGTGAGRPVPRAAEACGVHLSEAVADATRWARERGAAHVIVYATARGRRIGPRPDGPFDRLAVSVIPVAPRN
ncbi:hypothetical protein BTM25_17850 [Actinomadura rubteroloni]|uniref:Uncharacterized protein n=1 Tax=Actinomadura rubteroloni TaxID=1926885 RepID=A0A2P4UQP3_9ACTN|nr:hypothetical protein [Actinomadura rubteroloni]POM27371.1 hypothetical protein BTM25_17850 [Actinomadura rubteroloni]